MKVLVVGASGATGSKLVDQLTQLGYSVKVIVRATSKIPQTWQQTETIEIIIADLLTLSATEMQAIVADCAAVASCLGHNLTFKGMFLKPRRLVTEATRRLCNAISASNSAPTVKYVLMNSSGVGNKDLNEPISFGQKLVIGLLRLLLPPHVDNEQAADYLRTQIGQQHPKIEWVAVRPDGLINEAEVSEYELYPSPIRSAIFNAGKVSRINVAHCMARLIHDASLWGQWKGQMPVVYSTAHS